MAKVKIKSMSDLKNKLDKRMKIAVEVAHDSAMETFDKYLNQYYYEYKPKVYVRTYQLGKKEDSFVGRGALAELKPSPSTFRNGYTSFIMFSPSFMNHSRKRIRGANGKIYEYNNHGWSEEKILHEAMIGETHGGYKASENTPIWTCSLEDFHGSVYTNLREIMIDNLNIKGRWRGF